ncbi:uncharacterized protein LAESUDRAFT_735446 [Laetiporus sulphureus 93-53]|uniref:AN1-type domain-containing protein n=1 Tax=Laetiporus sulphureus 93-53 TaxID=1314785 RepID=A0A165FL70_9APHY|nr:uncharacterized protein LAESUDRAFT_735446 [Laetiporus sulphureus 93-53]KZT09137.1 hypothetical protein LAESUDRAFT_735446 [Laetiporus sulphureus 93-53]
MSSSSTPQRDVQLLEIGKQCSASSCLLVDFLSFKCQYCKHSFCREHYLPDAHKCDQYDATKANRVAPPCPLCNTPVAIPPGQDPNVRMEAHINTECSVMTGKSRKSSTPTCARPKCGKVLFSPIPCDKCKQQFCPQHRFPASHKCGSLATSTKPSSTTTEQRLANVSAQTSVISAAAVTAIQRAMASANSSSSSLTSRGLTPIMQARPQPPPVSQTSTSSSSSSSRSNPFSQTDR